jgi:hypothetical protein
MGMSTGAWLTLATTISSSRVKLALPSPAVSFSR